MPTPTPPPGSPKKPKPEDGERVVRDRNYPVIRVTLSVKIDMGRRNLGETDHEVNVGKGIVG